MVINDAPRFAWRGLMIDSFRHFLSIRHIEQVINSMTYAKLNVLRC